MRIASLVPSATEMLFALGLGDRVVAVTHECDYPPGTQNLPHLTRTVLPEGLDAGEIDVAVKATVGEGRALYELDEGLLTELAHELRGELEGRLASVRAAVSGTTPPRVIALEWLDPPYVGGHWVPEMISIAGGEDVAGPPGLKSPEVRWDELSGLNPDVVVSMPCGWYVEESRAQTLEHWQQVEALGARSVFAVDAASTFSRPGPRLVDGVELLGHLLHPGLLDPPGNIGFAELRAAEAGRA
jgi:iron complex transport system substrate-binding protein